MVESLDGDQRSINDRDRIDLDQIARGQRRYTEHHVRGLVISEQRFSCSLDNRQAFVAFVIDDVDGDSCDMRRLGAGSGKGTAEIGV